jgi:thiamine biosynthesis lipoprotein
LTPDRSGRLPVPPDPSRSGADYLHVFHAMATPCEMRLETDDADTARCAGAAVEAEARRIEAKYSRYRADSVVGQINGAGGVGIVVDAETGHLLDFAAQCHAISSGRFDITSGVLRRIWRFDGSDRVPTYDQIKPLRALVGWHRVTWKPPVIILPAGMEIDLGGLAKEYAVDRAMAALRAITTAPALVNFGGDLAVSRPRRNGGVWNVAIEHVDQSGEMAGMLELSNGALATSGDMRRYLLKNGVRYGHILNPKTARPVMNAPRSVTVAAATCIAAGMTATLAMLHGRRAETFLKREGVRAWCIR